MKRKIIIFNILILVLIGIFSSNMILALSTVPFSYNVLPTETINSIIDKNNTKTLKFNLYEPVEAIYYNNQKLDVKENSFEIETPDVSGHKLITFKNKNNEEVNFPYYFSNSDGEVPNYELVEGKKLITYVTTHRNIKIVYSNLEKKQVKKLITYLNKLPDNFLVNISSITMIPYSNTSNIAGIAKDDKVTLYNFKKYSSTTQKNILYHEIAHTWARYLMDKKVIDYSYEDFTKYAKADSNFVSNYAKSHIYKKDSYSEDFAESVSFFLINKHSFKKHYPNRYEYIDYLLNLIIE